MGKLVPHDQGMRRFRAGSEDGESAAGNTSAGGRTLLVKYGSPFG